MARLIATPRLDQLVANDAAARAELERVHEMSYYLSTHVAAVRAQTEATVAALTPYLGEAAERVGNLVQIV